MEEAKKKSGIARILPKLVLSLFLGGLFAWMAARGGLPLVPSAEAWSHVAGWTIPLYALLYFLTHLVRATRWRFLISPVKEIPLKEVIALNWIGFFAIFALPLRIGEVARPALTKLRHQISISIGFGTIAVERVVDGLITSICVAFGLFAIPRLESDDPFAVALPFYGYLALAIFGGAFVALFFFLWKRAWAVRMTEKIIGLVSKKLATLLADKVDGVADGIRSLADFRLTALFLGESLLYWGLNAAGMLALAWGCDIDMNPEQSLALMGILAIGILLPTGPGLFGNFQLALATALRLYFPESVVAELGAMYIFIMYAVQAVLIILAGVIPLYVMKLTLTDLLGAEQLKEGLSSPPPATDS